MLCEDLMFVVASAGLNVPRALIEHCRIKETPQQIVVDGMLHDVRPETSFETIDEWTRTAKVAPYPLGSSAPEYITLFNDLIKRTREVVVVTGTRKLLGSYDAAVAAIRVITGTRKGFDVRVFDTGLVELGAGLIAAYCGASARAGHGLAAVIEAGQTLAAASMQLCVPHAGDALLASSRSDLVRSAVPGAGRLPIIGMQDGESRNLGMIAAPHLIASALAERLAERYATGSPVWVTVTYATELSPARELLALLRRRFDVRYALLRPFGPAGYLVLGAKAIGVSVHPVAAMKLVVNLPRAR